MFLSRDEIAKSVLGRPRDIGRPITPAHLSERLSVCLSVCLWCLPMTQQRTVWERSKFVESLPATRLNGDAILRQNTKDYMTSLRSDTKRLSVECEVKDR